MFKLDPLAGDEVNIEEFESDRFDNEETEAIVDVVGKEEDEANSDPLVGMKTGLWFMVLEALILTPDANRAVGG